MADTHFADRLVEATERKQSQVVVGLDPRMDMMPPEIVDGTDRTPCAAAAAILRFNERIIDAVAEVAVAVKVQIAFYERFGSEGLRAYAQTIRAARERHLLVIGDVKRNDIGSTAQAYADAHLPSTESSEWEVSGDFQADAITINPLFGSDGVEPFVVRAQQSGSGLFALVKTSNPSSGEIQDLQCPDQPVYERIGALVEEWGNGLRGDSGYSLLGAVVGATYPEELQTLRHLMPHAIFLVPGFGAQGGGVDEVVGAFDSEGHGAVVNSSRGIIYAFRRKPGCETHGSENWDMAARDAAETMRRQIWQATH
jgi:orotidine-5'-phosphate decarboxylase